MDSNARLRRMVDAHFALIWRFLRGLGVPASAVDDGAQQVFVAASRRLDDVELGSERAFLFATARGVAANLRRMARRSCEVSDDDALSRLRNDNPSAETRSCPARPARSSISC